MLLTFEKKQMKRNVELVVISDVHLGTFGCHASELLNYLQSINPKTLVLNGDIIDAWQFSKRYFPASHMQVIKQIFELLTSGTRVYYLTGNHDEMLRKFSEFQVGNLTLDDKVLLDLNGEKAWIFHGDVFDSSTTGSAKFLAKLGGKGYDLLIIINRLMNFLFSEFL